VLNLATAQDSSFVVKFFPLGGVWQISAHVTLGKRKVIRMKRSSLFKRIVGCALICFAMALLFSVFTGVAHATDSISDATTTIDGYRTAAETVGAAVLLFVLGKRVLRKLV
jgi:succinate dehydrogenase/fumarate reductase cytochrome b subunit